MLQVFEQSPFLLWEGVGGKSLPALWIGQLFCFRRRLSWQAGEGILMPPIPFPEKKSPVCFCFVAGPREQERGIYFGPRDFFLAMLKEGRRGIISSRLPSPSIRSLNSPPSSSFAKTTTKRIKRVGFDDSHKNREKEEKQAISIWSTLFWRINNSWVCCFLIFFLAWARFLLILSKKKNCILKGTPPFLSSRYNAMPFCVQKNPLPPPSLFSNSHFAVIAHVSVPPLHQSQKSEVQFPGYFSTAKEKMQVIATFLTP